MARIRTTARATTEPAFGSVVALFCLTVALGTVGWLAVITLGAALAGWEPRAVISGSMAPLIPVGSVIAIDPGVPENLKPGQVVTFHDPDVVGAVITHRLVRRNPDSSWVTQGDANMAPDAAWLPEQAIIGKPRLLIPMAGLLPYWVDSGQRWKVAGLGGVLFVLTLMTMHRPAKRTPGPARRLRHTTDGDAMGRRLRWPSAALAVCMALTAAILASHTLPGTTASLTAKTINGVNSWTATSTVTMTPP